MTQGNERTCYCGATNGDACSFDRKPGHCIYRNTNPDAGGDVVTRGKQRFGKPDASAHLQRLEAHYSSNRGHSTEFAWVIEHKYSDTSSPEYFTSDSESWTKYHNLATRFSRQIDAQRFSDHRLGGMHRICEHGWFSESVITANKQPDVQKLLDAAIYCTEQLSEVLGFGCGDHDSKFESMQYPQSRMLWKLRDALQPFLPLAPVNQGDGDDNS